MSAASWLVLLVTTGCAPRAPGDLESAVQAHLAAVQAKDLDALRPTLTSTDELQIVFPNGHVLPSTEAALAFHASWFEDPAWTWTGTVERVVEGRDLGYALVRYAYQDTPEDPASTSWLVLVFRRERGTWRLLHDQNTAIQEGAPD